MAIWAHPNSAPLEALFNYLPLNIYGCSIVTPSTDSRLIYVDATNGDDGTAVNYTPGTLPNADNWNDPGAVMAYQTLVAARAQLRSGFPDWVLLKRGEEFTLTSHFEPLPGRSLSERAVVTAYGVGPRPHINPTSDRTIRYWGTNGHYQALIGIKVYPTFRDPDHVDFAGWGNVAGGPGIQLFDSIVGTRSLIIEDCWLEFGVDGISTALCNDIIIRRNIILNAYDEIAHAQGIWGGGLTAIIEENFFYHNGWYKQSVLGNNDKAEGQATIFNHNMYLGAPKNTIVRNNISISPSSIHVKTTASDQGGQSGITAWEIISDNNLMIDGEVGLSLGGNVDLNLGPRYQNMRACRNVLTRAGESQPTNRELGWGTDCQDWDGGFYGQNLTFKSGNTNVTNVYSRELAGHCSNVAMTRNIDVDIGAPVGQGSGAGAVSFKAQGTNMTNVLDAHNIVSNANTDGHVVKQREIISGITHRDNKYYSSRPAGEWFDYDGSDVDKAGWDSSTGDTGSTTTPITFVDSNRTIETYMTSLGQTPTLAEFIEKCKLQGNGTWDNNYTARYINAYFRAGYKEA